MREQVYRFVIATYLGLGFIGLSVQAGPTLRRLLEAIASNPKSPGLIGVLALALMTLIALGRQFVTPPRDTNNRKVELELRATPNPLGKADAVLSFLSLLLPSRIMKEDAGDAREVIDGLHKSGAPSWMIYTKLASAVFWILIAALREVLTVTKRKPN